MDFWNGTFMEHCQVVLGSTTVNDDANTDITGDRINLENYHGCAVVILKPAGTAGDDLQLEFQQHDAATSGNSKALTVDKLWFNVGATTLADAAGWVFEKITTPDSTITLDTEPGVVVQSQNSTYAVGAATADRVTDTNDALIIFDIKASQLDTSNGYKFFSMNSEGDAIGNALVLNVLYIPYGAKHSLLAPLSVLS